VAVVFEPDESNVFLVPYTGPQYLPTGSVTRYSHSCSGGDGWDATSAYAESVTQQMTVQRLRGHVNNGAPATQGWYFKTYDGAPDMDFYSGVTDQVVTNYRHVDDWNSSTYQKVQSLNVPASSPYDKTSVSLCTKCVLGHNQTERIHTTGHLGINI
jgi:hypothetical protein